MPVFAAVFFDIGDTLGTARVTKGRLEGIDVFPFVPPFLSRLKTAGIRLGVISNTGDEPGAAVDSILNSAGILSFFEDGLRIYSGDVGMEKDNPDIFRIAADRAGLQGSPGQCLFIGDSAKERDVAEQAGMKTAPDPGNYGCGHLENTISGL